MSDWNMRNELFGGIIPSPTRRPPGVRAAQVASDKDAAKSYSL